MFEQATVPATGGVMGTGPFPTLSAFTLCFWEYYPAMKTHVVMLYTNVVENSIKLLRDCGAVDWCGATIAV